MGIKGEWTRRVYERLLAKNIKNVLKFYNVPHEKIILERGRIYVNAKNVYETALKLTRVFGVSSVSPAIETTSDMDKIVETAVKLASATIESKGSFAVRCRRVGDHPYSSMDICREVGKQILSSLKDRDLRVRLKNPQFTINIEVRNVKAYIFSEIMQAPGGFPSGSQGKVVCLLSGGIDSAVACWLTMKRGCTIIPVYFDNSPFTDETTTARALNVAGKIFEWSIGFTRKLYVVPHGKNLENLVRESPRKLTCILCKRMMYRIAECIAEKEGAEGIVTGEAIGEQASQTVHNLRVLDMAAVNYPVHRPLLGFDKKETEALARKIGTFEISARKAKSCGAAPSKPAIKAKLEAVKEAEEKLDMGKMVAESIMAAKIVKV